MTTTTRMFRIEHNGEEWAGTFGVVITAAVTDFLSDGPFDATMTVATVGDDEAKIDGTIVAIDDDCLYLDDGRGVDRGTLLAIEVP